MKLYYLKLSCLLTLFIVATSFTGSYSQELPQNLKVMTYNIWNGFDWGKDTLRKESMIQWVRTKDPDVLALQELCGYDESKLQADAVQWGHKYVALLKTEGYPVGLTSKKPIKIQERLIKGLWHGMLHAETYGINFFVVHLSPADCNLRLKEANIIAERIKGLEKENYIILGDFNSHSPFDAELLVQNHDLLEKYQANKSGAYSNLRLGSFDYSVISTFIALPAVDISNPYVKLRDRYTFPTTILFEPHEKEKQNRYQERIDYIFTNPEISTSCTDVKIYNQGVTNELSDHFPIVAEFNFQ